MSKYSTRGRTICKEQKRPFRIVTRGRRVPSKRGRKNENVVAGVGGLAFLICRGRCRTFLTRVQRLNIIRIIRERYNRVSSALRRFVRGHALCGGVLRDVRALTSGRPRRGIRGRLSTSTLIGFCRSLRTQVRSLGRRVPTVSGSITRVRI